MTYTKKSSSDSLSLDQINKLTGNLGFTPLTKKVTINGVEIIYGIRNPGDVIKLILILEDVFKENQSIKKILCDCFPSLAEHYDSLNYSIYSMMTSFILQGLDPEMDSQVDKIMDFIDNMHQENQV